MTKGEEIAKQWFAIFHAARNEEGRQDAYRDLAKRIDDALREKT